MTEQEAIAFIEIGTRRRDHHRLDQPTTPNLKYSTLKGKNYASNYKRKGSNIKRDSMGCILKPKESPCD
jgi:hypothetical protein